MGREKKLNSIYFDATPIKNVTFQNWVDGNALNWTLSAGVWEQETETVKFGLSSLKLTTSAHSAIAAQSVAQYTQFLGKEVTISVLARTNVASFCRAGIDDGITVTYSDYHSGDDTWQELIVTKTVSESATKLTILLTLVD